LPLGNDFPCLEDSSSLFGDLCRHLREDAAHLGLLLLQQSHEIVVLLDGFQGFDEDSLSAGTGSMNDAVYAPSLLGLDRNHEAFAANSDQLVLHCAAFGKMPQVASQGFLNEALLFFDIPTNTPQLG